MPARHRRPSGFGFWSVLFAVAGIVLPGVGFVLAGCSAAFGSIASRPSLNSPQGVFLFAGGICILGSVPCAVTGLVLGLIGWTRGEHPPGQAVAGTILNACGLLAIAGIVGMALLATNLRRAHPTGNVSGEIMRPLYKLAPRPPWREVPPNQIPGAIFDVMLVADETTRFGVRLVASDSTAEDSIKKFLAGREEKYRSTMEFEGRKWLRVETSATFRGKSLIEICYASDAVPVMMVGQCVPEDRMAKTSMIDSLAATLRVTSGGSGR